ncbi:MAG TPA: hypothetical protein PLR50_03870, partial [Candidatus Rifleibacterium sp.]|nr:hypothetical protein [Candidatus Rifleibacterium sp.]
MNSCRSLAAFSICLNLTCRQNNTVALQDLTAGKILRLKVGDAFADRESIMHKLHCFKALIAGLFLALAMPVAGMAAASLDMNSVAAGEQYSAEKSEVAKYTDTE